MKKTKIFFFYCLFLVSPFLISACTTISAEKTTEYKGNVKKRKKSMHKKVDLAPTRIQMIQFPDRLRVILYSDVCFQPNGHLTLECSHQLAEAMNSIKQYGNGLIQIVGYTDDIYDPQMAGKISQRQADSVLAFLWSKGFGSQRLRAVGFGNHDSIASNQNVNSSSANRRVEIILVK